MTTKPQIPLAAARAVAERFVGTIRPYVERVEVAGSIRRGKPTVSDIEIVAIPKTHSLQAGLFGDAGGPEVDELHEQIVFQVEYDPRLEIRVLDDGTRRFRERVKYLVWEGIPLDLFAVKPPAQWGAILAIRTGPAAFSHLCVTPRAKGGAMPYGMLQQQGALWRGEPERGGRIIATPTEESWFEALGLPSWAPHERTEARLKAHLKGWRV